ncbi:MAG: thiamine-phosphate kinase [Bacteroidales bacterium]|nr:thiamine-phosphate kinase [Bacteroidales bacterium]
MQDEQQRKVTPLADLGEFGLIDRLTAGFPKYHASTVKGVGDDAAIMEYGGQSLVMTTDMLTEGVHFDLTYTPLRHLGYKAAVVNFSDVYAMNAVPRQMVVALAVSGRFSVEALEEFYAGIRLACEKYQVDLVGGDTTTSLTGMTISITVVGDADRKRLARRDTAREGDLICVSGDLGAAYMGLQVLERERKLFADDPSFQPSLKDYEYVVGRFLKPEARRDMVEFFDREHIVPHAMIDISDGLSSELLHLCHDSHVGCKVFNHKIPIEERTAKVAEEFGIEPVIAALSGGEDYELLFTVPTSDYEKLLLNPDISIVGHVVEPSAGCYLCTQEGTAVELKAQGWNHYQ